MKRKGDTDTEHHIKRNTHFVQGSLMIAAGSALPLFAPITMWSTITMVVLIVGGLSMSNWPVAKGILSALTSMVGRNKGKLSSGGTDEELP